jgi:hypothetical protein
VAQAAATTLRVNYMEAVSKLFKVPVIYIVYVPIVATLAVKTERVLVAEVKVIKAGMADVTPATT